MKIGAGCIVRNEERDLPAALLSVAPFANVIWILDTGSTDDTRGVVWGFQESHPEIRVEYETYLEASEQNAAGEWCICDFSKARNAYIAKLESVECNWIFSIDADDEIEFPEKVRPLLESGKADAYDFQIVDNLEHPNTKFSHMRAWRARRGVEFKGVCHESPLIPLGFHKVDSGIRIWHHWAAHEGVEPSPARNLRILQKAYAGGDKSSRTLFYLANSYRDVCDWPRAIDVYKEYLDGGQGWHDEIVYAWLYLARCCRFGGSLKAACEAAYRGLAVDDRFSELWMELCYANDLMDQKVHAQNFARLAMRPLANTSLFLEPNKYTDQPWRCIAHCSEKLGDMATAAHAYREVVKLVPGDADMIAAAERTCGDLREEEIPFRPRIKAKHFCRPGAAGDVLMCLYAVQIWHAENPGVPIIFHSHPSYREIVEACPAVDSWMSSEGVPPNVVQMIGYPLADGYPNVPMKKHLREYFSDEIGVKEYALGYLDLRLSKTEVQRPYITIQPVAGWSPYKNWPMARWQEIVKRLIATGWPVLQLGGEGEEKLEGAEDCRGKTSLLEAVSLIAHARLHLGVDSFGNHATAVRDAATLRKTDDAVILWGSTSPTGSGYVQNVNIWQKPACSPCYREYAHMTRHPKVECPNGHACMEGITVEAVWESIDRTLRL